MQDKQLLQASSTKIYAQLNYFPQLACTYHLAMSTVLKYANLIYDFVRLYIFYNILYIC